MAKEEEEEKRKDEQAAEDEAETENGDDAVQVAEPASDPGTAPAGTASRLRHPLLSLSSPPPTHRTRPTVAATPTMTARSTPAREPSHKALSHARPHTVQNQRRVQSSGVALCGRRRCCGRQSETRLAMAYLVTDDGRNRDDGALSIDCRKATAYDDELEPRDVARTIKKTVPIGQFAHVGATARADQRCSPEAEARLRLRRSLVLDLSIVSAMDVDGDDERYAVPGTDRVLYIPDFISPDEEQYLVRKIQESPQPRWRQLVHRRLQTWGGELMPPKNVLVPQPLPAFVTSYPDIVPRIVATGAFARSPHARPNHIIVNEYLPGQGIMAHEDGPAYHPVVATLSLGASAVMHYYAYEADADADADDGPVLAPARARTPTLADTSSEPTPTDTSSKPTSADKSSRPRSAGTSTSTSKGAVAPTPALSLLLEPRSLVITSRALYTEHLHGIDAVAVDAFVAHADVSVDVDIDGVDIGAVDANTGAVDVATGAVDANISADDTDAGADLHTHRCSIPSVGTRADGDVRESGTADADPGPGPDADVDVDVDAAARVRVRVANAHMLTGAAARAAVRAGGTLARAAPRYSLTCRDVARVAVGVGGWRR